MATRKSILVIGIGNTFRGDDGVGPAIAEQIGKMIPRQVDVRSPIQDGFSLIQIWKASDCVFLIDAVSSGGTPGRLYRFDALNEPLPRNFFTNYSTHDVDLFETISLAGKLDMLPKKLIVYGVEGKDFSFGAGLSHEVRKAVFPIAVIIAKAVTGCTPHDTENL